MNSAPVEPDAPVRSERPARPTLNTLVTEGLPERVEQLLRADGLPVAGFNSGV